MTIYDPYLSAVPRKAALCSVRHTYSITQAELEHSPGALSRSGGGEGTAACKHSQDPGRRPALIMCSPVGIDGWSLWRQHFMADGPQL